MQEEILPEDNNLIPPIIHDENVVKLPHKPTVILK